jgi:ferredoxin
MARRILRLDPITCDGHGICADLFPARIALDDWGFPIVDPAPIPEPLLADARRAVTNCPVLALRLEIQAPGRAERR